MSWASCWSCTCSSKADTWRVSGVKQRPHNSMMSHQTHPCSAMHNKPWSEFGPSRRWVQRLSGQGQKAFKVTLVGGGGPKCLFYVCINCKFWPKSPRVSLSLINILTSSSLRMQRRWNQKLSTNSPLISENQLECKQVYLLPNSCTFNATLASRTMSNSYNSRDTYLFPSKILFENTCRESPLCYLHLDKIINSLDQEFFLIKRSHSSFQSGYLTEKL